MKKKTIFKVFFSVMTVFLALTCIISSLRSEKIKADSISDLTNTTWTFNNSIMTRSSGYYNINFTNNNTSYSDLNWSYLDDDGFFALYYHYTNVYVNSGGSGTWNNDNYKTISITGGSDVTNSNLISWLQTNATQQQIITGTQIAHRYWSPYGVITMTDNQVIGDNDIEYTVLFNEFTDNYDETVQTGLKFLGVQVDDPNVQWSYIESINGSGINILYHGTTNNINNAMWLEFTPGDYIDTDLYDLMSLYGHWFDDDDAYIVGMNQGYVEGRENGIGIGEASSVQYTNLITTILNGLGNILTIEVFPNITIALILGLPLLLGVLVIIIKILRG